MSQFTVFFAIAFLLTWNLSAQTESNVLEGDTTKTEVFYKVDNTATFPGGFTKFYAYLGKNLRYPAEAKRLGVQGKVQVEFVIEATGEIRKESVRVVRGLHPSCDQEAIRLIKECPKWNPAFVTTLNKNVPQKMVVPVSFRLSR